MKYTLTISDDKKYIIVKTTGEITREGAMKQNIEAHALGRANNINRFLVDATEAINIEQPSENYAFANKDMMNTEGVDKFARVATLVTPGDHSHDFVETVSRNAGLNIRIFTDREAALKYLLKE